MLGKQLLDNRGNALFPETGRLRRAQEAMKACRRAWEYGAPDRAQYDPANPFEKAGVKVPSQAIASSSTSTARER